MITKNDYAKNSLKTEKEKRQLDYYRNFFPEGWEWGRDDCCTKLVKRFENNPHAPIIQECFTSRYNAVKYYLEKNEPNLPKAIYNSIDFEKLCKNLDGEGKLVLIEGYSDRGEKEEAYIFVTEGPLWEDVFKERDKEDADYEK